MADLDDIHFVQVAQPDLSVGAKADVFRRKVAADGDRAAVARDLDKLDSVRVYRQDGMVETVGDRHAGRIEQLPAATDGHSATLKLGPLRREDQPAAARRN